MQAYGELDDVLGLTLTVGDELVDPCTGKNGKHAMKGLFRQSVFGRLGGKIDAPLKDAEQRAKKPDRGDAMPIYDKPTKELMREFATERLTPGQVFNGKEAVAWFAERYPNIKNNTVSMHVYGMAVNSNRRKHVSTARPGGGLDLFYKLGPNQYRLWDPDNDPAPMYRDDFEKADERRTDDDDQDVDEETDVQERERSAEFAYEADLKNYLARNLHVLEGGLTLYEDEDGTFTGLEFPVGGRFIDILACDRNGDFVVIELKVSRGYDRVIGQLLRYMAWISKNLADGRPVRGVIVASKITEDLLLATSLVGNVALWQYQLSFQMEPVAAPV